MQRWPGICCVPSHVGVFESNAVCVDVERAVVTPLQFARSEGAELIHGARVTGYEERSDGVSVSMNDQMFHARQLVLAVGALLIDLLEQFDWLKFAFSESTCIWFEAHPEGLGLDTGAPCFFTKHRGVTFTGFRELTPQG